MQGDTPELSREQTPQSQRKKKKKAKKSGRKKPEESPIQEEYSPQRNLADELEQSADPLQGVEEEEPSQSSEQNPKRTKRHTMPSGGGRATSTGTTPTTVKIGGVEIKVNTTASSGDAGILIRSKKEDRMSLDEDKRDALFYSITKVQHTVFEEQPLTIASIKDLEDTYNLSNALQKVEIHFTQRDVIDVFTIVYPQQDANGNILQALETDASGSFRQTNLFEHYNEVSPQEVAASCIWYIRWPKESTSPWFKQNLVLSYKYFQNHMSEGLFGRVLEDLQPFHATAAKSAGPLLFKLMIDRLQVNSHVVVDTIKSHLPTLRIDQYQGENVDELVSHLRTLLKRLKGMDKHVDGQVVHSNVPTDFSKTLLKVLQTSSDARFNEVFSKKFNEAFEKQACGGGDESYGDPYDLMTLASKLYQQSMTTPEGWTGVLHKRSETAFSASVGETRCFNCGKVGCSLRTCREPQNAERIKRNKKEFFDSKKGATTGGNKFGNKSKGKTFKFLAIPTSMDKNRALVSKKWYFWHFKDEVWKLCRNQKESHNRPHAMLGRARAPAPAPAPAPPETPPTTPATGPDTLQTLPTDGAAMTATTPGPTTNQIRQQVGLVATQMNNLIQQVNQS